MKMKIFVLAWLLLTGLLLVAQQNGKVGINTNNPQNTLHVAGTLRVDSAKVVTSTKRFAVLDSSGVIQSLSSDSVKSMMQSVGGLTNLSSMVSYASAEAQTSTTSTTMQTRVTLTLSAGTYLLFGYFEAYNTSVDAGVRGWLYEGATELAYGIVYSNTSTFGSWSAMKQVAPTVSTNYTLNWSSWPASTTSNIRRARLVAIKVQ